MRSAARHIGTYQRKVASRSRAGERGVALELRLEAGRVAALPQVDRAPVAALQLGLGAVVGGGERDHLVGDGEALAEPVRVPERDVPGVERGEQGVGIAGRAGRGDRRLAERAALGRAGA